jgi:hypothetical protein
MRRPQRGEGDEILPLGKEENTRNARYVPRDPFLVTELSWGGGDAVDRVQETNCDGGSLFEPPRCELGPERKSPSQPSPSVAEASFQRKI